MKRMLLRVVRPALPHRSETAVVLIVLALLLLLASVVPRGRQVRYDGHVVAATDIIRVTLTRHGCMGSCPRDSLTFSADGRARYSGDGSATRNGSFSGIYDTDRLFAAIAATDIEARGSARVSSPIDFPYTTLHIERRSGPPVDIQAGDAARMPGIDAAAALAVAGADREVRWQRDDGIAAWLGPYQGSSGTFYLFRDRGRTGAVGTAARCRAVTFHALPDELDVLCGKLRSRIYRVGNSVRTVGTAIASGEYVPITPHAYALAEHEGFAE